MTNDAPEPARCSIIPVLRPRSTTRPGKQGRNADLKVANYMGFFIESRSGNNVYGRITPVIGNRSRAPALPAPAGAFPKAIRLVE